MKIGLTGSTGLIGTALVERLVGNGHSVTPFLRGPRAGAAAGIPWDPRAGTLEAASLRGLDAVIHLAGESIAGRWTAAKKARIRDSRVSGTRLLAETLAAVDRPPRVLLSASAIGFYGDRGDERLDEASRPGTGFLPEVCREWEAAAGAAAARGVRVVFLRFGVVLSRAGGALARMLPPFRLGIGGRLGHGRQFMSWISIDDAAAAILHALENRSLEGPVNVVAPEPVDNREFTRRLARVLRRPALFPMPAAAVRLLFGEMGQALLLASTRVEPARLRETGFRYRHPGLEEALRFLVGKS